MNYYMAVVAAILPLLLPTTVSAIEASGIKVIPAALRLGNSSHTIKKYCARAFTSIKEIPLGLKNAQYCSYDAASINASCDIEMGKLRGKCGLVERAEDACAFDVVVTIAAGSGVRGLLFVRREPRKDIKYFTAKNVPSQDIFVGTIKNDTFFDITARGDHDSQLALYAVEVNTNREAAVVWVIACLTVAVGSVWSGSTRKTLFLLRNWRTILRNENENKDQDEKPENVSVAKEEDNVAREPPEEHNRHKAGNEEPQVKPSTEALPVPKQSSSGHHRKVVHLDEFDQDIFDECPLDFQIVVILVMFMGTSLLFMYYFSKKVVYVMIVCVMLGSMMSLIVLLDAVAVLIPCASFRLPNLLFPCFVQNMEFRHHLVFVAAIGLPVLWFTFRDDPHGWILQNTLGVSLALNITRCFQLPNFKFISLILAFLFCYDIFMVFVTAFLQKGQSVMEEVATGVYNLPVLVRVPFFDLGDIEDCLSAAFGVILGYGDIVVPGLAVSYCRGYDVLSKRRSIYFIVSMLGYSIGLVLTFVSAQLMDSGQPALLYLVPSTLIPPLLLSWCRGDLKAFWLGNITPRSGLLASIENILHVSMSSEAFEVHMSKGLLQVTNSVIPWIAIPVPVTQETYDAK
ncbi:signal peptide peptidase-like 2C isoform X2 [Ornithodoros turicata]|uniref:signal peptide peptidase-like 2C isoform X2 n=1 Tax=Ornithodoros turicata TaxID=34597 RepID=UPI003138629B